MCIMPLSFFVMKNKGVFEKKVEKTVKILRGSFNSNVIRKSKLDMTVKKLTWVHVLATLLLAKLVLHFYLNGQWSFHRDELLYLALGRHLDWGYASVPAGVGFWAWISQNLLENSVESLRSIATLVGTGTVLLTGLMAKEMLSKNEESGAGKFAMLMVGLAGLTCAAFLRPCMLFMPVVFDIFYCTLLCWLFLKYINTEKSSWLVWFGVATGLGLMNKYAVSIFLFAMLPGILLSKNRSIFANKWLYISAAIALLIFLPNIIWQIKHGFPVFHHMSELAETQFKHVSWSGFFADQVLFFIPILPIWLMGLWYLLFHQDAKKWRIFGLMYLTVLAVLLFFNAKSYYSLGAYPVLIAAGAAYFERLTTEKRAWLRYVLPAFTLVLGLVILPAVLPLFPPQKEAEFIKKLSKMRSLKEALRWEDGEYHTLPQDFADMLGWQELGEKTGEIWQQIPNKSTAIIYAENYGQAGAIEQFGKKYGITKVISFSDAYFYWLPDSLPSNFQTFIYINDELGDDMPLFFQKIEKVWQYDMPLSRQHGNQIYLCQYPTPAFFNRMNSVFKKSKY